MRPKPFYFVVPGQPVTKKNSQIPVKAGRHTVLLPSKAYRAYEKVFKAALGRYRAQLPHFTLGVRVEAHYYLQDRRSYPDLVGLMQATADLMEDEYATINHKRTCIKHWLLSNDRIIKSWDGTKIAGIDKENPRAEIIVTPLIIPLEDETDPQLRKILKAQAQPQLFA